MYVYIYKVSKCVVLSYVLFFVWASPLFSQDYVLRRAKTVALSEEVGQIKIGNIGVIVHSDYEEMSRAAVEMLMKRMRKVVVEKGEVKIGLPTGNTPQGLYEILQTQYRDDPIWERVTLIQLDEYVGASPDSPESFQYQIRRALVEHFPFARFLGINGSAEDILAERARYEEELTRLGELDILVLGIGANGHLAFNEPGFEADNRVGIAQLTPQTKEANDVDFDSALTITLKTILSASEIIVIASGEGKSSIVEEALLGEVLLRVPASFLQRHLRTTYVIDASAASPALKKTP